MKTGLLYSFALAALRLTSAHPHRPHHHAHLHKRAMFTKVEVQTVIAHGVVHVDEYGKPLFTVFKDNTAATASPLSSGTPVLLDHSTSVLPSPSSEALSSSIQAPSTTVETSLAAETPIEPSTPADIPVKSSVSIETPTPAPVLPPVATILPPVPIGIPPKDPPPNEFPLGITYSPYLPGRCKTKEEVENDFKKLSEYKLVRLYGTDCNQIAFGVAAAQSNDKKLILGIFDIKHIDAAINVMKNEAGDFSTVRLITIGNEEVLKGTPPSAIVNAVKEAREKLSGIGYKGLVSTVETWGDVLRNKELCDCSDVATVNAQAFFTKEVSADQAGHYVRQQVEEVKKVCGHEKRVVVTEAGWPKQGEANGKAVPSLENHEAAIRSLKESFKDGGLVLFTAFDDKWKSDFAGSFNAETHWGIMD